MTHVASVPVEFLLFAATLLAIALAHRYSLQAALTGLAAIIAFKLAVTGFDTGPGLAGLGRHFLHEWVTFANLLCLLLGFALLSRHFEDSHLPEVLAGILPDDWTGPLALLVLVFVISGFLDNIAAALIGGAMAHALFGGKVRVGYLAALVAASNAGGAGSVIGDTTTTMMWIDGVAPVDVLHAYVASATALLIFGIPAALAQQRYSPIMKEAPRGVRVDYARLGIVVGILAAAIAVNVYVNSGQPGLGNRFPFIGAAVVAGLILTAALRRPDYKVLPEAMRSAVFLLALVGCASLMPVEVLPAATWQTTFGLGFISSVFDNIPLTALALAQGGYDWGVLAYAVGFGGSMLWFGSSAGVAMSSLFPEVRSVSAWLREGWPIVVGYVVGFFALLLTLGWEPHAPHRV